MIVQPRCREPLSSLMGLALIGHSLNNSLAMARGRRNLSIRKLTWMTMTCRRNSKGFLDPRRDAKSFECSPATHAHGRLQHHAEKQSQKLRLTSAANMGWVNVTKSADAFHMALCWSVILCCIVALHVIGSIWSRSEECRLWLSVGERP